MGTMTSYELVHQEVHEVIMPQMRMNTDEKK
jgi:hypothetical protein